MSVLVTNEPRFQEAFASTVSALRRLADYALEPSISERLRDLSERKEYLNESAHDELMALVAFTQRRSQEKLEALAALRQLHNLFPELVQVD